MFRSYIGKKYHFYPESSNNLKNQSVMKEKIRSVCKYSLTAVCAFLLSCQNDDVAIVVESSPEETIKVTSAEGLEPTIKDLEISDAEIVAKIYAVKEAALRSRSPKTIKNTVSIPGPDGIPAVYAVNFQDGFILVSASKKYYPILADIDSGEFSFEGISGTELKNHLDEMIANVTAARAGEWNIDIRLLWNEYTKKRHPSPPPVKSRESDDYWEEYTRWWFENDLGNCNVYYLHECYDSDPILPKDVYEAFLRAAQDEDLWEGTDYSWWWTAYVVEREAGTREQYGALLKTLWHQDYPFAFVKGDKLGCVAIAVGQTMKYFEHPKSIDWSKMPERTSSVELQEFLASIKKDLGGKSANDGDAKKVLKKYGYNVSSYGDSDYAISSSIKKGRPVITFGSNTLGSGGHCWVVDGYYHSVTTTEFVLYRLADNYYPSFHYIEAPVDKYQPYSHYTSIMNFHHNWGWKDGSYNGWYGSLPIVMDAENKTEHRYNGGRKSLIINSYQ